ncbi:hypothetical protein PInf_001616 [Phytophthora infestans]|nr:hypothetical protein PInf_001616 [Phytophthora infestans]
MPGKTSAPRRKRGAPVSSGAKKKQTVAAKKKQTVAAKKKHVREMSKAGRWTEVCGEEPHEENSARDFLRDFNEEWTAITIISSGSDYNDYDRGSTGNARDSSERATE